MFVCFLLARSTFLTELDYWTEQIGNSVSFEFHDENSCGHRTRSPRVQLMSAMNSNRWMRRWKMNLHSRVGHVFDRYSSLYIEAAAHTKDKYWENSDFRRRRMFSSLSNWNSHTKLFQLNRNQIQKVSTHCIEHFDCGFFGLKSSEWIFINHH